AHQCVVPISPSCSLTKDYKEIDEASRKIYPMVVNIGNVPKPTGTSPSLLYHSQEHNFMNSDTFAMLSALILPSIFSLGLGNLLKLENWIWDTAVLKVLSSHYQTPTQSLPDSTITALQKSRGLLSGYRYSRQAFMSLFDLVLHGPQSAPATAASISTLWSQLQKKYTNLDMIPNTDPVASWYHPAMGYDAGYYSYLWSEVLSSDAFSAFEEAGGCSDAEVGLRYRECVLEPGATRGGMEMLRAFLGREPNEEAFLKTLEEE
ncbi:hypothetical protein HK096_000988, partial [Nowakowskiella sp. JEL0078]